MKVAVTGTVLCDLICCRSNTGPEVNTQGHVNKAISWEQETANSTAVELDIITYNSRFLQQPPYATHTQNTARSKLYNSIILHENE